MAKKQAGGKKGGKKYGNNQAFCLRYRNEGRRKINKKRKLESHLRRYPEDSQTRRTLKNL